MRLIGRRFVPLVFLSLAIPTLAGYLVSGTPAGAVAGLLWGGAEHRVSVILVGRTNL